MKLNGLTQYGNLLNPSGQRAVSDFDRRHRFVVSYNYDLPIAKLLHGHGSSRLVNGWRSMAHHIPILNASQY